MSSHTRGRRTVPDILAQPARCTQRDDQVGEAHALACGYPTALRWGYHGVRLPRAAHKAHPSPGRRRRTQVRLASPAERWGGFGTCVQNKTTGQRKSAQLPIKAHPPSYNTTTASGAKATRRTSTSTRKASRQSQINTTHRSPAKPNQGPVTLTPSTYDSDQQAPSHGPKVTDNSSPTRISEPKCPIVN